MAWEIDPSHSEATFSVKHMMFTTVRGHFNVLSGHLHIDEEHPEDSWVDAQVDATSVDTRDEKRDGHLRSPDFFDAEHYPVLTFKSTKVEKAGGNQYKVLGDLTMHGVTKSAKTKVNRKEWGLNWNAALEGGGVLVSEDVNIEIDLEALNKA
ncbi:MAG: YceI family protein [Chloroflexi bacterium]|nr:MAG: YceI family protein [Chloroflexota bacterium]